MELVIALTLAIIGTFIVLVPLTIVFKIVSKLLSGLLMGVLFVGMFVFFYAFDGWEVVKGIVM